jgi:hypothetical protein
MKIDLETLMKKQLEQIVGNEIDELIHDEVDKIYRELCSRKDKYIAELMKSIRIYTQQESIDGVPRYLITVENNYKIKEER